MKKIHRGDDGYTDIFGLRLPKDSPVIEFIGELDEFVSLIGLVKARLKKDAKFLDIANNLTEIQKKLMHIASYIAKGGTLKTVSPIAYNDIINLERDINNLWSNISENRFVIPGATEESALIHLLRTICRRVERRAVKLLRDRIIDSLTYAYLNRLSDWLYIIALYINKIKEIEEEYLIERS